MTVTTIPLPTERMGIPKIAAATGKGASTVRSWITKGVLGYKLRSFKLGYKIYVTRDALNDFLTRTQIER